MGVHGGYGPSLKQTSKMRFELYPGTLRKVINLGEDRVQRTISFDAPLEAPFQRFDFDQSALKDGRTISSLPCVTNIRAADDAVISGSLIFVPAYSIEDLGLSGPVTLELEVHVPRPVFDELWNTPHEGRRFLMGGEIEGIPSKYQFGSTRFPHEWDVQPEENRTKRLTGRWFGALERPGEANETKQALQLLRVGPDKIPQKYAEDLLSLSKYPKS